MGAKTGRTVKATQSPRDIPARAVREYIADMLAELCRVAEKNGQDDLYVLLKLTTQAVRNSAP